MRYGFVIDQRRCIGCHACTVACKEENEVPLGVARTWVKYIEKGTFPDTPPLLLGHALQPLRRRALRDDLPDHGALPPRRRDRGLRRRPLHRLQGVHAGLPLRRALHRPRDRDGGQVQLLRAPGGGGPGARVRRSSAPSRPSWPATSTIPATPIARLVAGEQVQVRKPEKGTRPKLFYIGADAAALDPGAAGAARTATCGRSGAQPGARRSAGRCRARARSGGRRRGSPAHRPGPRTTWRTPRVRGAGRCPRTSGRSRSRRARSWSPRSACCRGGPRATRSPASSAPVLALLFLALTRACSSADLRRPERFLYLLTQAALALWLVRGA